MEKLELGNNNSVSIIFNDGSSTKIEELVLDADYTPLAFTDNLSVLKVIWFLQVTEFLQKILIMMIMQILMLKIKL